MIKTTARPLKVDYSSPTEDLAYIVGVLMGDGCLTTDGKKCGKGVPHMIRLNIAAEDREFLDAFARAIGRQFGIDGSIYEQAGRIIRGYQCRPTVHYSARTDLVLLHLVVDMLSEIGIPASIHSKNNQGNKWGIKPQWRITIPLEHSTDFYQLVVPTLERKRKKFEEVIRRQKL